MEHTSPKSTNVNPVLSWAVAVLHVTLSILSTIIHFMTFSKVLI